MIGENRQVLVVSRNKQGKALMHLDKSLFESVEIYIEDEIYSL